MQECEHKTSMCQCVNWKKDDLAVQVNHLMSQFAFVGFELEYTTLEPEENRRLCKIGRCRICGRTLCLGTGLPTHDTVDDLLAKVYRWAFQLHPDELKVKGTKFFREMFLALFHENDQDFVREWLSKPENQNVHQMYRHSTKEDT